MWKRYQNGMSDAYNFEYRWVEKLLVNSFFDVKYNFGLNYAFLLLFSAFSYKNISLFTNY